MKETFISVASEGGGAHAIDVLSQNAELLARAVRRAVPFLSRRRVLVDVAAPHLATTKNVGKKLEKPTYVSHLVVEPGGARARLCFDAGAIAFLLDGSLCGDGTKSPKLTGGGLSAAQTAFIEQLSESLVRAISRTLEIEIGLALKTMPTTRTAQAASGSLVALKFSFIDGQQHDEDEDEDDDFLLDDDDDGEDEEEEEDDEVVPRGAMVLAISKSALMSARAKKVKATLAFDDRVVATMGEVPVEVVAELGRLKMSVAELSNLRVGHTLRVPVPVSGAVDVLVEGVPLFKGRPTTTGSQLAIQLLEVSPTLSQSPTSSHPHVSPTADGRHVDMHV